MGFLFGFFLLLLPSCYLPHLLNPAWVLVGPSIPPFPPLDTREWLLTLVFSHFTWQGPLLCYLQIVILILPSSILVVVEILFFINPFLILRSSRSLYPDSTRFWHDVSDYYPLLC